MGGTMASENKGQLMRIFPVFVLILVLTMLVVTAENIDTKSSGDNPIPAGDNSQTGGDVANVVDLCEGVDCGVSTLTCSDGFTATCENSCVTETGSCNSCVPSCEGHDQINDNVVENNETDGMIGDEVNQTYVNETGQEEVPSVLNETIPSEELNATVDENETTPVNDSYQTTPGSGSEVGLIEPNSELNVEILYPEKIIRGEVIDVKAVITNSLNKVKNVKVDWTLPDGFSIVSGDQEICKDLNAKETCELNIKVETSLSTSLGKGEIKAVVNYEI